MSPPLKIIQWNRRSVKSSFTDLHLLAQSYAPDIIMLQETWLHPSDNFSFQHFFTFHLNRPFNRGGGLATLISAHLVHSASVDVEKLSDYCEILGIRLRLTQGFCLLLLNAYFPTGCHSISELDSSIPRGNPHMLMAGDFNSHNIVWGPRSGPCDVRLWSWLCTKNFSIANTGSCTFFRGAARSVIDLPYYFISGSVGDQVGYSGFRLQQ